MNIDLDKTFGEAFPSPRELKKQLIEISRNVTAREVVSVPMAFLIVKDEVSA